MNDKTLIEWNADVGTRFLTIHPDGSFEINENTPPLYALGELAKAFMRQQDRIKQLDKAGDKLSDCADQIGWTSCESPQWIKKAENAVKEWREAKEAKL
jgi:hypothetical protein